MGKAVLGTIGGLSVAVLVTYLVGVYYVGNPFGALYFVAAFAIEAAIIGALAGATVALLWPNDRLVATFALVGLFVAIAIGHRVNLMDTFFSLLARAGATAAWAVSGLALGAWLGAWTKRQTQRR